jgi:hypothetical protein
MWKKTLGMGLLVFVLSVMLQGCYSQHRAYYRDDYAPGYISFRYRSHGPSYRVRQYRDGHGRHYRKFEDRRDHHGHRRHHH